ncbi:Gag-Pol polyprotein [Diplonema papillatum]|nr:Gag-Pol polyprotein [Diplonema papillatum]
MYGDCSGFYADPDLVMKAVSTMDVHHGKGFKWDREQGLMKLSITLEDGSEAEVHLIPFVTSTTSQRDQWFHTQMATSISDTESSESDGVGCYNCGDHGHMQRHCPRSRGCYTCGEFGHFSRECTSR